tara:strand:- start:677 stop:1762 length:1086 start_codon:yes stop_codon:yes gene_type:complete
MLKIEPKPGILDIALYEPGSAPKPEDQNVVKLSSNENPYGPSRKSIDAITRHAAAVHLYPSTNHLELRQSIAARFGLKDKNIICGVGSDEIISFLCQAFAGPGDEVIHTEHGFAMYKISTLAVGAKPVEVREKNRYTDVDAILEACSKRTKLIFIANPNNPTSTMIDANEVLRLADGIPENCILVLDGAYAEYVSNFDGGASLIHERENVFMTRTFSKMYGLGGLRIGWGYGSKHVIDILNRIRGPFNLSTLALAAADSALTDVDYVAKCRNENSRLREWLSNSLVNLGIESDEAHANFILARFKGSDEASACYKFLKNEGLLVRQVKNYNLPNCLRITIGDEAACKRVYDSIRRFLEIVK